MSGHTLLTEKYLGHDKPLHFLCSKCGQIGETSWRTFQVNLTLLDLKARGFFNLRDSFQYLASANY